MSYQSSSESNSSSHKAYTQLVFWIIFGLIFLIAAIIRIQQIEARPLHSDEGVNWHFLKKINESAVFYYSYKNYHGPLYFWLSYFTALPLDFSVLGLRLVSIISGIALIPGLLLFRRYTGNLFILLSSLFIAVSPSLVFFSRYGIHETLLLLLTLILAGTLYRMFSEQKVSHIYYSWLLLALLVATKETYTIIIANIGLAFLVLPGLKARVNFLLQSREHLIKGFFAFIIVLFAIFTSGFQHFNGIRELLLGTFQWIGRGTKVDVGHFKPFSYYVEKPLGIAEPQLLLAYLALGLFGLYFIIKKILYRHSLKEYSLGIFLGTWSYAALISYSLIPYKTVWLVIDISLPLILFCSYVFCCLNKSAGTLGKIAIGFLLTFFTTLSAYYMIYFNYSSFSVPATSLKFASTIPYGKGNPFSYVHTSAGMLEFIADLEKYWQTKPAAKILIGTKSYWPLPYYLRAHATQLKYGSEGDFNKSSQDVDIVTIDHKKPWAPQGWLKKYYRFSDVTEANVYFREPSILSSRP